MVCNLRFSRDKNLLILETDDLSVQYYLETIREKYEYIPYKKEWGYTRKLEKIYEPRRGKKAKSGIFEIGPGWAGYLLGVLKSYIPSEQYNQILLDVVYAETYRQVPFPNLRDYQNDDVLFLLKYKRGLMTVNTGYGLALKICRTYLYSEKSGKIGEGCDANTEVISEISKGSETP